MTSFEVDTTGLNTLANAVLSLTEGLGSLGPALVTPTGSSPLDTTLTDFGYALDQALAALGRALHAHGTNASVAGLWYQRVEHALAVGR